MGSTKSPPSPVDELELLLELDGELLELPSLPDESQSLSSVVVQSSLLVSDEVVEESEESESSSESDSSGGARAAMERS